jgi:KRAB domain-containing zinc finger protein
VHELRQFECHHCHTTFKAKHTLKKHMSLHSNSIVYPCNQCPAQFFKHAALHYHSLICSKSNVNNLNCMDVPAPQKQTQVVTDVMNVEKEYKCLKCEKIFSKYKNLYDHNKIHKGIIFRCAQCPSTYKSKNGLTYHLRTDHELRKFECQYCQTTFKTKKSLKTHMTVHFISIDKEYKCLECGKIFSNYHTFYNHKKMHEGIIYRCAQCPSTYKSITGLNYHLKTHRDLRQFECHHCQTTFNAKNSLKSHMFLHFNSIFYPCNQCSALFQNRRKLVYHKDTVHSLMNYQCNQCSKNFKFKAKLVSHCRKHKFSNIDSCVDVPAPQKQAQVVTDVKNVEKEYKCLECGNFFSNYHKFYNHKRMHEGIIYRCAQCPSTYQTLSGLRYHSKTVHELRQFECHHCQSTFKAKVTLKSHMTVHFNSIVYPCNQCSEFFKTDSRLFYHQKMAHSFRCHYCSKIFKSKTKLVLHFRNHITESI